jgi:alkaline phosphatase
MNLIQRQIYGLKRLIASILSGGNLLQFSDSPTNAYWKTLITGDAVTNNNNYSASEDVALAPDSSMSGDRFYNSKISSNAYSFVYEDAVNIISGTSYVFSIYAKKDTTSFIQLVGRGANFGLNTWANFNIETGVLGSKGINCTSSIVDCKDGWFRCSIVALATASGIGGYSVSSCFSNTDARLPYANQFEYSVFIFGMKLEIGTAVTDYVNPKNGNYVGTSKRLAVLGFATDLHYSDLDPYVNNYPRDGVSKLQTAINYWNQRPIDAVVMNGDYTDGGFSGTSKILTEQEQIDKIIEAENVFNTATAPRKYTLGNHDMDSLNKAQNIANIASLNASYYFYDLNGVRFIHLDANYMFDNDTSDFDKRNWRNNNPVTQYVNPAQRNWLTNTLNSATTKVVVFCHQGLHSDTNNLNVTNASVVRGILESTGKVVAVFTGHEHVNLLTTINNIPYYSMKAMTSDAYPTTAYAEIRLYEKSIKVDGFGTQSSYVEKFYDLPVFSVPASYDTDAKAFLTASQVADTIQQSAINDLVLDLKSANIWTKMKAVYPIVGGTALTHKWNLKNPFRYGQCI